MLVHYPHNLCSIHSRTAAKSDNRVRLKSSHLIHTFFCTLQCRVRSNFIEACMLNSHFIQFFFNRSNVSILIQESICYDKRFLLMHNCSQFIKRYRHTAFLKVNLLRCSKPQHVFSPLCNSLNVNQVFYAHVLRYRVSTPGTTSKRKRRSQLEVI